MVIIYTDSQYAQSLLLGSSTPVAHHQLVILAQQYFTALRTVYRVHLLKVPSHEGIPGNELADRLAKKGVHSSGKLGRFSTTPSTSLRPPDIGFNEAHWTLLPVTSQDDFLQSHIKDNFHLIPELPLAAKASGQRVDSVLILYVRKLGLVFALLVVQIFLEQFCCEILPSLLCTVLILQCTPSQQGLLKGAG